MQGNNSPAPLLPGSRSSPLRNTLVAERLRRLSAEGDCHRGRNLTHSANVDGCKVISNLYTIIISTCRISYTISSGGWFTLSFAAAPSLAFSLALAASPTLLLLTGASLRCIVAVDWSQSWRYSRRSDDLLAMLRIIRPHVHPIPSRRDERRETYSAAGRTLAGRDG